MAPGQEVLFNLFGYMQLLLQQEEALSTSQAVNVLDF
jgi:hypothetical protein